MNVESRWTNLPTSMIAELSLYSNDAMFEAYGWIWIWCKLSWCLRVQYQAESWPKRDLEWNPCKHLACQLECWEKLVTISIEFYVGLLVYSLAQIRYASCDVFLLFLPYIFLIWQFEILNMIKMCKNKPTSKMWKAQKRYKIMFEVLYKSIIC